MSTRTIEERRKKHSEWAKKKKIAVNKRCTKCDKLIYWRNNKTGLCRSCSGKELSGDKAFGWKGGRHLNDNGYIIVYHPTPHHRKYLYQPYVLEHILVWEKANNRLLPDGYTIHHLNGIRTDNRPENLTAIKRPDHKGWTYSKCLQERIRELEEIITQNKLIMEA